MEPPPAKKQKVKAQQAQEERECSECGTSKTRDGFSRRQWISATFGKDGRCKDCADENKQLKAEEQKCAACGLCKSRDEFFHKQWRRAAFENNGCCKDCISNQQNMDSLANKLPRKCTTCGETKLRDEFSSIQWIESKPPKTKGQCLACLPPEEEFQQRQERQKKPRKCYKCGESKLRDAFSDKQWGMAKAPDSSVETKGQCLSCLPYEMEIQERKERKKKPRKCCKTCGEAKFREAFSDAQWGLAKAPDSSGETKGQCLSCLPLEVELQQRQERKKKRRKCSNCGEAKLHDEFSNFQWVEATASDSNDATKGQCLSCLPLEVELQQRQERKKKRRKCSNCGEAKLREEFSNFQWGVAVPPDSSVETKGQCLVCLPYEVELQQRKERREQKKREKKRKPRKCCKCGETKQREEYSNFQWGQATTPDSTIETNGECLSCLPYEVELQRRKERISQKRIEQKKKPRKCSKCGEAKPQDGFSKRQWSQARSVGSSVETQGQCVLCLPHDVEIKLQNYTLRECVNCGEIKAHNAFSDLQWAKAGPPNSSGQCLSCHEAEQKVIQERQEREKRERVEREKMPRRECANCGEFKPRDGFSDSQWVMSWSPFAGIHVARFKTRGHCLSCLPLEAEQLQIQDRKARAEQERKERIRVVSIN